MLTYFFNQAKLDLESNFISSHGHPITVKSAKDWCLEEWATTYDYKHTVFRFFSVSLINYSNNTSIITYTSKLAFLYHYCRAISRNSFKHIVCKCDHPELLI